MIRILNKKNIIFLTVLLIGFLVVFSAIYTQTSFAAETTPTANQAIQAKADQADNGFSTTTIGWIIYGFLYIIGLIVNALAFVAGHFLDWVLSFGSITKIRVVEIGWDITRSAVNMIFALILLGIAFATILRIESYGIKKILPKLILVALLINFSLFIGGTIIDFSQVLTDFFIDRSVGNISEQLMIGLGVHTIESSQGKAPEATNGTSTIGQAVATAAQSTAWGQIGTWIFKSGSFLKTTIAGPPLPLLVNKLLSVVLISVAFFVFLFLAFLFFIRIIALWILLILSPIAWVFGIVPGLSNLSSKWWREFIKWTFFAPAASFFIFLSLQIHANMSLVDISQNASSIKPLENHFGPFFTSTSLFEYLAVIGLLIGAIMVGKTVGGDAASFALKGAKGISHGMRKWAGGKTLQGAYSERLKKREGDGGATSFGKALLRGSTKALGFGIRPEAAIPGIKERLAASDKKAVQKAADAMSGSTDKTFQLNVKKKQNEANKKGPDFAAQNIGSNIEKDSVAFDAYTRNAMAAGKYEDTFKQLVSNKKIADTMRKKLGLKDDENIDYSAQNLGLAIESGYKRAGLGGGYALTAMNDMKTGAAKKGHNQFNNWTTVRDGKIGRSGYARSGENYLGYSTKDGKEVQYSADELKIAREKLRRDGGFDSEKQETIINIHQKATKDAKINEEGTKKMKYLDPSAFIGKRGGTDGSPYLTDDGHALFNNLSETDVAAVNKSGVRTDTAESALKLQKQILAETKESKRTIVQKVLDGFRTRVNKGVAKNYEAQEDQYESLSGKISNIEEGNQSGSESLENKE